MGKTELEKMIVEETKDLSSATLVEVLDFIQFVKAKKNKRTRKKSYEKKLMKELTGLNKTSLIHLEEEFSNYKELYPREQ